MENTKSKILICGGLLLIAAALCLGAYNLWDAHRAAVSSERILQEITVEIPALKPSESELETADEAEAPKPLPEYVLSPEMEMPEVEIDGQAYIGKLDIPSLELSLPVMSEWSYPKLKLAPCRYQGSAYLDDLIICAHNYDAHFGRLKELEPGNEITFTDAAGNAFSYSVTETEVLATTDTEKMENEGWDLTLFTCTVGGEKRVTIRCERQKAAEE